MIAKPDRNALDLCSETNSHGMSSRPSEVPTKETKPPVPTRTNKTRSKEKKQRHGDQPGGASRQRGHFESAAADP